MKRSAIKKILTPNDVGVTGTHQAGILVPKDPEILSFFPELDRKQHNPRVHLWFVEPDGVTRWEFAFIYYNNELFGGTRNEYRLTRMTKYLRAKNAQVGDQLELLRVESGTLQVDVQRSKPATEEDGVLKLSGGWKVIPIK